MIESRPRFTTRLLATLALSAPALKAHACQMIDGDGGLVCDMVVGDAYEALAETPENAMSARVASAVNRARKLAQAQKYADMAAALKPALALKSQTPREKFALQQMAFVANYGVGDYRGAADALGAALESGVAPDAKVGGLLAGMTQIYYRAGDYPHTIDAGSRYIAHDGPDADIHMLVGQARYITKDFPAAMDSFRAALKVAADQKLDVSEEWLRLLVSGAYQLHDNAQVIAALEQLVASYPKPEHWRDLLQMVAYAYRDPALLDVYRLRLATGVMAKPADYTEMVALALEQNLPGEARAVLERGYASGAVAADAAARDRITASIQERIDADQLDLAHTSAPTGDGDIAIGEALRSYGRYDEAIAAIERGLARGASDPDAAHLRLGMTNLSAGRTDAAQQAFLAITPGTMSAQLARLWVLAAAKENAAVRVVTAAPE